MASVPSVKSVKVSLLEDEVIMIVSLPDPEEIVSLPAPPSRISSPSSPKIVSSPSPPEIVSLPSVKLYDLIP